MIQEKTLNVCKGAIADIEKARGRDELKRDFVLLRSKGLSFAKIAKELDVSKSTLISWSKDLEAEIARLKAIELEALYEEAYLLKTGRIALLSGQMKALQEELAKRDLGGVATDKLMDLWLRFFGEMKEEYIEPIFSAPGDKAGPKLTAQQIQTELAEVLHRYRAGRIDEARAKGETAILRDALRAYEKGELEGKIDRIESVLNKRGE